MSYKKLVRDNIPEIIKCSGQTPIIRTLSEVEYKEELEKKLYEECEEAIDSNCSSRIEELADIVEVVSALAKLEGESIDIVMQKAKEKRLNRGGFDKRIYLEDVK